MFALRCVRAAMCASYNVYEWEFVAVAVCGGPTVCEINAVWGSSGVGELR